MSDVEHSWKRNFILYVLSRSFLTFGSEIFTFTVSFFIMYETGSAVYASINLAIYTLISLIFLPLAGVVSDSNNKKRIIILGELLDSIILIGLFTYVVVFDINIIILYITTALFAMTSSFVSNAFQSAITSLFSKNNLQKVYGYTSTLTESAELLGPIVAGALIGLFSFEFIVVFFLVFNFIALGLDILLDFERYRNNSNVSEDKITPKAFLKDISEGVQHILNTKVLKMIVIYLFSVNFVTTGLSILPSKMLINVLELNATLVGIAYAALSLGGITGGLVIGSMTSFKRPLLLSKKFSFLVGLLIICLPIPIYLNLSDIQNVIFVSVMFILIAASVQFISTPILSYYQTTVPDEIKGRVFSLITVVSMMTMPVGFLIFGFLYDLDIYFIVNLFSGVLFMIATLFLLKNKVIELADLDYQEEIEKESASV